MRGHRANLDLLRAIAITAVLIHHIGQSVEGIPKTVHKIFSFGSFGVDLFFILSGWLIGGIFFREYAGTGSVRTGLFWARRWLRTMPPYYAALLLSWLAVYFSRHESFDFRYLFFLQNYSQTISYFKISWSLCVEEHFYIFIPLVLFVSLKTRIVPYACAFLILASFTLRLINNGNEYPGYGFLITATSFRLDGLVFGVLCAYYFTMEPELWPKFSKIVTVSGIVGGVISIGLYIAGNPFMYSIGILSLSAFFAAVLCISVNQTDWSFAKSRLISSIAVTSYSIYLMHALAINVALLFVPGRGLLFVTASIVLTIISSYIFHNVIENGSIKVRDKWFPANAEQKRKPDTQPVLGQYGEDAETINSRGPLRYVLSFIGNFFSGPGKTFRGSVK